MTWGGARPQCPHRWPRRGRPAGAGDAAASRSTNCANDLGASRGRGLELRHAVLTCPSWDAQVDESRRFIVLIDQVYESGTRLIVAAVPPSKYSTSETCDSSPTRRPRKPPSPGKPTRIDRRWGRARPGLRRRTRGRWPGGRNARVEFRVSACCKQDHRIVQRRS